MKQQHIDKDCYTAPLLEVVVVVAELGIAVSGEVEIADPEVNDDYKNSFWN